MSFPASPTNGQTATVNNITYQYTSASNSWRRVFSAPSSSPNVSGGTANQILYQAAPSSTSFISAPSVTNTYLKWNGTTFIWGVAFDGGTITNDLINTSATESSSTTSGSLQLAGGAGIVKNLYVGGTIFGNLDKVPYRITVGTTAPSSPAVGDLWVDTN